MTPQPTTIHSALAEASTTISRRDAESLLLHILQQDRAWLFTHSNTQLHAPALAQLRTLTQRRAAHEPLQYLTGQQEFFGLTLRVTPDTLIPRPETEHLVEAALDWLRSHSLHTAAPRILDIGTGTGAIALALAAHLPRAHITACDLSPAALAVARHNAAHLGLSHRITFLHSDLLAAVSADTPTHPLFDVIVSNPPYIPTTDLPTLQPEVADHEPHTALFAGPDGLDIYRRIIPQAHAALRPGGLLALELGYGQRDALANLLQHWSNLTFMDDYATIPRVVLAERPASEP